MMHKKNKRHTLTEPHTNVNDVQTEVWLAIPSTKFDTGLRSEKRLKSLTYGTARKE